MAASIGEQLRLAREGRGVGLREISDQTRISIRYLEAIESNDYGRLPGGVFNRSFIRAYARYIGYDEREAIEGYTRYLREHGDLNIDVATTPMHPKVYTDTPATRSPILTFLLAILILALLTAGALAAMYWFQRRAAMQPTIKTLVAVSTNSLKRYNDRTSSTCASSGSAGVVPADVVKAKACGESISINHLRSPADSGLRETDNQAVLQ